jgi:hypothetical protein
VLIDSVRKRFVATQNFRALLKVVALISEVTTTESLLMVEKYKAELASMACKNLA